MSNTQQNTSKLCTNCNRFYGNPANENLCSSCSKKKQCKNVSNSVVHQTFQIKTKDDTPAIEQPIVQIMNQEEIKPQKTEVSSQPKQEDHSRCWSCKKKVNLLGIKCKCEFTFCNKHRIPEDHECKYDHASFGKELLKQHNPLIQKEKLEKI